MGASPGAERAEPLSLWIREPAEPASPHDEGWNGVRPFRFEYTSRGDRVPGRLLLPTEGSGRPPLVLLQHGAGGSKEADYLDAAALPWVRRGAAVASIDLPLHGERTSAKLSELLIAALADPAAPARQPEIGGLWDEFVRQSLADLGRALDALESLPELDASRVAFAGFSLGAMLGTLFVARDPRPCAAALALAGGGLGPEAHDPARHVAAFAPRPLLLLNAERDERVPRSAAEALHAAAAHPVEIVWVDSGHADIGGRALKAIWQFLARELGLP